MGNIREFKPRQSSSPTPEQENQSTADGSNIPPVHFGRHRMQSREGYDALKRDSMLRQRQEEIDNGEFTHIVPNSIVDIEAVRVLRSRKEKNVRAKQEIAAQENQPRTSFSYTTPEVPSYISKSAEELRQLQNQIITLVVPGDPDGPDFT